MKPIIKWAGGKRWLVPLLETLWKPYQETRLVEPFTGGMAVALGLNPKNALLNDVNGYLINFYEQVKKGLKVNVALKNNADFFYEMRDEFNHLISTKQSHTKKAAIIFYFLIRTGYNGLCRFNSEGAFNVPFGQHRSIKYKEDFFDYQPILSPWEFSTNDFEALCIKPDDFLYVDPPYDVPFTKYHSKGFDWADQLRLAEWLSKHPGPMVVSNEATPRILELYQDLKFKVRTLPGPRMISCKAERKPALEMLACKNLSSFSKGRKVLYN